MSIDISESKNRQTRIGDLLEAHRRNAFVGREAALAAVDVMLGARDSQRCLFFHGPGGIGKSTLMQRVRAHALTRGLPVIQLDARLIDATPAALREAILEPLQSLGNGPVLLLLDTCEYFGPILAWIFGEFLDELDPRISVVGAGRVPPDGVPAQALDYFSEEQARRYLLGRGLAADTADEILGYAGGSPLALAMASDLTTTSGAGRAAAISKGSNALPELALRMLRDAGTPAQTGALRAAALAQTLSPALLGHMLPDGDGAELFEWLSGLSCIESAGHELTMHDIARTAIANELSNQAPQLHDQLCRRAEDYYREQMQGADPAQIHRGLRKVSFLSSNFPVMRDRLELLAQSQIYPSGARAGESEVVANWIEHFQGARQRRCFEYWHDRQPSSLTMFRGVDGEPAGCAFTLTVDGLSADDTHTDSITNTYCRRLRRLGLPAGRRACLLRFWTHAEQHLAPTAIQVHALALVVAQAAAAPGIAYFGVVEPDTAATRGVAGFAGHEVLAIKPARLGDTPVMITFHDYRDEPVLDWLIDFNRRLRAYTP